MAHRAGDWKITQSVCHDQGTPEADDRTEALVAATEVLLAQVGLDGLTIRAVLSTTGLARRAFYDRFESKDALVLAVFERTIRAAADRFASEITDLDHAMDRLRVIVEGIALGRPEPDVEGGVEASRRSAALAREHMRLAETRPVDLRQMVEPLVHLIEGELARGMARGEVRIADKRQLAVLVYNLVSITVQSELLAEETDLQVVSRRQGLAAEIWEFTRRAIAR